MLLQLTALLIGLILCYPAIKAIMCLRVCLHELGHYCANRYYGLPVSLVEIGEGPVVFSKTDRHGTNWVLHRHVANGGFVETDGGSPDKPLDTTPRTDLLISAAGPAADVLFIMALTAGAIAAVKTLLLLLRHDHGGMIESVCVGLVLTAAVFVLSAGLLSTLISLDVHYPDSETDFGQIEELSPSLAPHQDRWDRLTLFFVSALKSAPNVVLPVGLVGLGLMLFRNVL